MLHGTPYPEKRKVSSKKESQPRRREVVQIPSTDSGREEGLMVEVNMQQRPHAHEWV